MRYLIVEEALRDGRGHWPTYIGGIAAGLRSRGDSVDILAHRHASADLLRQLHAIPCLRKSCWEDQQSQGMVGGLRHNASFQRDLAGYLQRTARYDWVMALTVRLQHLAAFACLARKGTQCRQTQFLLLFVQGFGQYAGDGSPVVFPRSGSTLFARLCFRLMRPAVMAGRIHLAAETVGMQTEMERFTGLPWALFPHPVEFSASAKQSVITSSRSGTVTITCPGFARHEKGSDLLQEAIKQMLSGAGAEQLRFVLQWPTPFALPDGRLLGPDPVLLSDSRVTFLNHSLNATDYDQLLDMSDLVVLPYRRHAYHNRVSRVAIEAASRGIPLVYTSGTWSGEVAALSGAGVEIAKETVPATVEALRQAIANLPNLRARAVQGAHRVAAYHSVDQFRRKMVTLASGRD
ncbi:MAG: glycosyltransferase [Verrucomicrobiota bacterium]|nr:glycosyltransferase [Verrucomicrobiota bacterium]